MQIPTFTKLTRSYPHTNYLIIGIEGEYIEKNKPGVCIQRTINRYNILHLIPKNGVLSMAHDMVECDGDDIFDTILTFFQTGKRTLCVANDSLILLGSSDFVQLLEDNRISIGTGNVNTCDYAFEGEGVEDTLTFIASAPPTVVDLVINPTGKRMMLVDIANYGIRYIEDIYNFLPKELQEQIPNYAEMGLSINKSETCCALMARYMQEWYRIAYEHKMGAIAPTYSGQAMRFFRLRHYQNDIKPHRIEEVADLEEQCYLGGRAEARYEGKYTGKCYLLDVQSMYPAHAIEKPYPVELADYQKSPTFATIERWLQDKIVFAHCEVKDDQRQFPVRRNAGTIFPTGTFNAYLVGEEFIRAYIGGSIQQIYFAASYRKGFCLSHYATDMLRLRTRYKEEGNRLAEFITKFITNGLWGKFGQIGNRWVIDTETVPTHSYGGWYYHEPEMGNLTQFRVINGIVSRLERSYYQNNVFAPISAIANSYGRDFLWRCMQLAGIQNVLYCCHDGIIITDKGKENLSSLITSCQTEYGKFRISEEANECYIAKYGVYRIGNKKCYMGCPRTNAVRYTGFWNFSGERNVIHGDKTESRITLHKYNSPLEARDKAYDECINPGRFISPTYLEEPELVDPVYHRGNRQKCFPFAEWLQ